MQKEEKLTVERTTQGWRRSPRTVYFATKVTPEFDKNIRERARKGRYTLAEMLEIYEKAFDIVEQKNKSEN